VREGVVNETRSSTTNLDEENI
jgi:hypothetical protein